MNTLTMEPSKIDTNVDYFKPLSEQVQRTFAVAAKSGTPLFYAKVPDLYDLYLSNLPTQKQQHTCSCCRHFINRYGSLVSISESGTVTSAMWSEATVPEIYLASIKAMRTAVEGAAKADQIVGPAFIEKAIWGIPEAGGFAHFHVDVPKALTYVRDSDVNLTGPQTQALFREYYKGLRRNLSEYPTTVFQQAVHLFSTESLARSERYIEMALWLLDLKTTLEDRSIPLLQKSLKLRRASASAALGWNNYRSGMMGTLLEDIHGSLPLSVIKGKFDAKMAGDKFMRPTAAPTVGAIEVAEKTFATLGLAPSLDRRFARLEDLKLLWSPVKPSDKGAAGGVFGHLKTKEEKAKVASNRNDLAPQKITWAKFREKVLPSALKMKVYTNHGPMDFCSLTTASDPAAPLLFKWDNPVSFYRYLQGSLAKRWNVKAGSWVTVTGVTLLPWLWTDETAHSQMVRGGVFILKDAKDMHNVDLALFPENMRTELHAVRKVIEAHSKTAKLKGAAEASAAGLPITSDLGPTKVLVKTALGETVYIIDRLD